MKILLKRQYKWRHLVPMLWLLLTVGVTTIAAATPVRADGTETHGTGHQRAAK